MKQQPKSGWRQERIAAAGQCIERGSHDASFWADGFTTLADQLRAGVDAYTVERLQDPVLDQRIRAARKDQDELLARLSKPA